jgi:DNA-binding transcriptional ArsR family regulator
MSGFEQLVRRAYEEGYNRKKAVEPYSALGFSEDPFEDQLPVREPSLLVGREGELSRIPEELGVCAASKSHLLLVAPNGAGTTTFLRILVRLLNRSFGKQEFAYYFSGEELHSLTPSQDPPPDDSGESEEEDQFTRFLDSRDFAITRVLVFDNVRSIVSNFDIRMDQMKCLGNAPTVVLAVDTSNYLWLLTNSPGLIGRFSRTIWIQPLSQEKISELLVRRIRMFKDSLAAFDEKSVTAIAQYSLGLPGVAIQLVRLCMKSCSEMDLHMITTDLVVRIAELHGYDVGVKVLKTEIRFDGTKERILKHILAESTVRRVFAKSVAMALDLRPSALSYHMHDLVSRKIINFEREGLRVYYSITQPVTNALEVLYSAPGEAAEIRQRIEKDKLRREINVPREDGEPS